MKVSFANIPFPYRLINAALLVRVLDLLRRDKGNNILVFLLLKFYHKYYQ